LEIGIRRPFAQPRSDLTSHPGVSQFPVYAVRQCYRSSLTFVIQILPVISPHLLTTVVQTSPIREDN
jgi:hypothetical protein